MSDMGRHRNFSLRSLKQFSKDYTPRSRTTLKNVTPRRSIIEQRGVTRFRGWGFTPDLETLPRMLAVGGRRGARGLAVIALVRAGRSVGRGDLFEG